MRFVFCHNARQYQPPCLSACFFRFTREEPMTNRWPDAIESRFALGQGQAPESKPVRRFSDQPRSLAKGLIVATLLSLPIWLALIWFLS
jgi:hypothetical protein